MPLHLPASVKLSYGLCIAYGDNFGMLNTVKYNRIRTNGVRAGFG